MNPAAKIASPIWPSIAWLTVILAGFIGPVIAVWQFLPSKGGGEALAVIGPILAIGLMGSGIIGAAVAGRLSVGIVLSLLSGLSTILLSLALDLPPLSAPLSAGLVFLIASISFAARGFLFSRSMMDKGWWMALFVVAGEAAILITAAIWPGQLPDWLLALLPAQWTNMALHAVLIGASGATLLTTLFALAATAAATLSVALLWPRRWPYLIMCSTWLVCSALVWNYAVAVH
ncbi:MAG: hypothetical protein SXU28_02130 [Pseudomonadota bacterium]|nr:hypothetical protein [Pseudomonadota bacterium]